MLINDLPQKIKELALERSHYKDPNQGLIYAFNWDRTPEGNSFWDNVNNKAWDLVYAERPDLQEPAASTNPAINNLGGVSTVSTPFVVPTAYNLPVTNIAPYSSEEKKQILNQIFG